jgi:hypothetical protein
MTGLFTLQIYRDLGSQSFGMRKTKPGVIGAGLD